jgi:thiol-disulfide isomerase/thioredoxin
MLLEFYGKECPPCVLMDPRVERLEKEEGLKVEKYEVWHNEKNADFMAKYAENRCLGVPFFFNTENNDFICGAVDYDVLKEWALGKGKK